MRDAYATTLSHIVDVDFAEEAANLARTRILQEVATSLLAQANLQPRIVLSLLRVNLPRRLVSGSCIFV